MKMEVMALDTKTPDPEVLGKARDLLLAGGVIAYRTETLYGLGADARNKAAVDRVRLIKGRPTDEPVSVIAADVEMAREWVHMDHLAQRVADVFWPGPLTLILPLRDRSLDYLIGSSSGLGIRVPSLESARMLSAALKAPVTATSANITGGENLLSSREIENRLAGKIDLILDSGRCEASPGSTLLDLVSRPPKIIREGVITSSDLSGILNTTGS